MKKSAIGKILLSVFLVYHLLVVLMMPNGESLLGRVFYPFVRVYAAQLAVGNSWQFFSPNPRSTFVEFELAGDYQEISDDFLRNWQGKADVDPDVGEGDEWEFRYPPKLKAAQMSREAYIRRMGHAMFVTRNPEVTEKFFVPWICRRYQGAEGVTMRISALEPPSIERASMEKMVDFRKQLMRAHSMPVTYPCPAPENLK